MSKSKSTAKRKQTAVSALTPDKLRQICQTDRFTFASTAELQAETQIIGQPRGTRSIAFGIGIGSHGYNIYALGAHGTGRATAIEHFLQQQTQHAPYRQTGFTYTILPCRTNLGQ